MSSGTKRWWRYAVLRGNGIPPDLNGVWYDLDEVPQVLTPKGSFTLEPSDMWEQREDGEVAVVYLWYNRTPST